MKIDIRILTCDRARKSAKGVNYIHTSIVNFLNAGGANGNPLSLYVSHPNTKYVEPYREQFKIFPADQEITGYENFLRSCAAPSSFEFMLILEDDLDFSSNFITKLAHWLTKHSRLFADNLITLYAPYVEINQCLKEGKEWWNYPIDGFYGTQALLATPKLMRECGEFIKSIQGCLWDMAIKQWLKATHRSLISTVPCLVQHIGVISSLHGQDMHITPGFLK